MKNKKTLGIISLVLIILVGVPFISFAANRQQNRLLSEEVISVKTIGSQISASGSIHSQSEATLHFQTGGKLVFLPFQEGDQVYQGQTIAQLDTYTLQKQLTAALNTYRSTRDTFDQTQNNSNNRVLQGQERYNLELLNKSNFSGQDEADVINGIIQRVLDQNQATLDNSVINVELANYALQLASLTTPIDGIVVHEDVNLPNINITPQTSFSVADPTMLVFRANVLASDVDFISVGSQAQIKIDGVPDQVFLGTVVKIYPQKVVLSSGENVYQVDIQSDSLKNLGKLGQGGTALIKTNTKENVILVPTWLVLSQNFIWVEENGKPKLKQVAVGKTHGEETEIISGLSSKDKIILNPQSIVAKLYKIL